MDAQLRREVLIAETRAELKTSVAGFVGMTAVTVWLAIEFLDRADAYGYFAWAGAMAVLLSLWLGAWLFFALRPPDNEALLGHWIPGARVAMTAGNLVTAASVWVFLPPAPPELRALMIVLYAWYLIIQLAAASEATQVIRSAVLLVLGSLITWLIIARPPYALPLALFLALFGASLIAIRRLIRAALIAETTARAAADAARQELGVALAAVARERDAKTRFIRAASHDLQQPLQAAALFLDQLQPRRTVAAQTMSVAGARNALAAARGLVTTMVEHLRLDGGAIQPRLATLSVGEVLDRVLLTQAPAAAAAGVQLRTVGRGLRLSADRELLARAVENLVANAIRHSGGRRVLIGARARADAVWIWVIDDGTGLAPSDIERIFQPFEQGGRVGAEGGFGLGLASARGLALLMGGECGADPRPGRGARFFLRLAGAPAEAATEARCAA